MIKKNKGKWQVTYKELPLVYQLISQQKHYKPEKNDMIYLMMKRKNLKPKIFYPARLSFRFDGKMKAFQVK